jgi:hypothetical protein
VLEDGIRRGHNSIFALGPKISLGDPGRFALHEKDVFTNFEGDKKIMVRPLPYHTLGLKIAIGELCSKIWRFYG